MLRHREKGSKYGNVNTRGMSGIYYRSKAERDHALWLEAERRSKRIKGWQYEVCYSLYAATPGNEDGIEIGHHKPDFTVTLSDGRLEVHEVKGGNATKTEAWGLRRKLFEANYPNIRYRLFEFGSERKRRVIEWD